MIWRNDHGTDNELRKTGTDCRCNCTVFCWSRSEKAQAIPDKYIPIILGAAGIVICAVWVVATCPLDSGQNIAMAIFTAIVQGILVAGLSTYVNQIIKQVQKTE